VRTLKAEGGEACTCLLFKGFLVELIGFTFLCRIRLSLCAEILIMFRCGTLDQKVNARSLGSFTGIPPTPQAGSRVDSASIPNSPRSNIITLVLIFFWND
jgi:hypothetical protein